VPKVSAALPETINTTDKIARRLALLVIKGIEDKQEQSVILSSAGFSALEVAEMLRVGKNYVNVALHRSKPRSKKRATKKRRL
jgi:DNA-directed RNA polymerase specialized sigma24 family protein